MAKNNLILQCPSTRNWLKSGTIEYNRTINTEIQTQLYLLTWRDFPTHCKVKNVKYDHINIYNKYIVISK